LRSARERPNNPDAADLAMQAQVKYYLPESKATMNDAVTLSERALALDPQNVRALTVLADTLNHRVANQWSEDPAATSRARTTFRLRSGPSAGRCAGPHGEGGRFL
jgi:adenylate cyclase